MSDLVLLEHPVWRTEFNGWQLIEASAGTGKTWTIAGLFVRAIVEQGVGVESILTVTYTRAATDELKRRVAQALQDAYEAMSTAMTTATSDANKADDFVALLVERAQKEGRCAEALYRLGIALANVDRLAVYTMHGFGQRVAGAYSTTLGLSRESSIVTDTKTWLRPALDQYWQTLFDEAGANQSALAQIFVAYQLSPSTLAPVMGRALGFALADVAVSGATPSSLVSEIQATGLAMRRISMDDWSDFGHWLTNQPWDTRHPKTKSTCIKKIPCLVQWLSSNDLLPNKTAFELLESLSFATLTGEKHQLVLPAQLDPRLALCNDYLKAHKALDTLVAVIASNFRQWCEKNLATIKRALALQTYDDALLALVRALADLATGPALARDLAMRYPIVFVDESQDTDRVPWTIFQAIYDGAGQTGHSAKCLIAVGDPKQSIYRFRGADVFEFLTVRKRVKNPLTLSINRRSTPQLVDAVNALFSRDNVFRIRGLDFVPAQAELKADDANQSTPPLTWVWLGEGTKTVLEPKAIKGVVHCVLNELALDTPEGDIAILVASNRQAGKLRSALARVGVTSVIVSRDSILMCDEAKELQHLLAAIIEPNDSQLLRAACATRLVGANAHQLAQPALLEQYRWQFAQLANQIKLNGLFGGLRGGLVSFGTFERLASLVNGERRLTNLHQLLELLGDQAGDQAGDQTTSGTNQQAPIERPSEALQWLVRGQSDESQGEQLQLLLENDTKLVNIVTLHSSKGLQYPVVIMPFSWNAPQKKNNDWTGPFLDHPDLGQADQARTVLDFRDPLPPDVEARKGNDEDAESVRIFYVGATRAQRKMILFNASVTGSKATEAAIGLTIGSGLSSVEALCNLHPQLMRLQNFDSMDTQEVQRQRAVQGRDWLLTPTPEHLPKPWRFTSYTSMLSHTQASDQTPDFGSDINMQSSADRDAQGDTAQVLSLIGTLGTTDVSASSGDSSASIRETFIAGAQAGICLHSLLEHQPFDKPCDTAVIASVLAQHHIDADPAAVAQWLDQVLAAPLSTTVLALNRVPNTRRLTELEFMLSAFDTNKQKLNAALKNIALHAQGVKANTADTQLQFSLNGLLRGFIDCVFESDGKYYILDWKSNHLGTAIDAYGPAAMQAAMIEHRYDWQAAIYIVALHRYLATSLAHYDPVQHLGGAWYLFLRGAGDSRRPAGAGLFHYAPPLAAIIALDDALRESSPADLAQAAHP